MDEIPDAKRWCETALRSVFCLWDYKRKQSWRGAQEHAKQQLPGATKQLRPTATFNAVMAFGDCGLFQSDVRYSGTTVEIRALQLEVTGVASPVKADEVLRTITANDQWVDEYLNASEHGRRPPHNQLTPRAAVMLGRMVPAISRLACHVDLTVLKELQGKLVEGMGQIATCFTVDLFPDPVKQFDETPSDTPATISPQIVMYAAIALHEWTIFLDYLLGRENNATPDEIIALEAFQLRHPGTPTIRAAIETTIDDSLRAKIASLTATCKAYLSRQVDRQMARKHVPLDPNYDCASLAFALNGLARLDERIRSSPFFQKCVAAVVEGQNPDGCWPEGITVASHESNDVGPVRQPSVEIALSLAECVFRRSSLFRCQPHEIALLEGAIPALHRQLRFLAASFQELQDGRYCGWEDDRLRAPGEVRMQVNAMASRLINFIRLAEIACDRAKILERYKPEWPATEPWRGGRQPEDFWSEVIDPDEIAKPCEIILNRVVKPIADQMRSGHYFLRPAKNGVSFILYGPPGSGKTFVVSRFAAALGWPLIGLNPGYFIEKGLELIEAVAGGIFADLMKLDHAVVFFDECDELFRDRADAEPGVRNILSFATASMLPKLQRLHDARKVIFVLGTNFVQNIDLAIRRPGRFDAILLFDRPDHRARDAVAANTIAKRRGTPVADLDAADKTEVQQIANSSAGWMIEQVISRATSYLDGKTHSPPATADYEDWCTGDGEHEISAAGVEATLKDRILARWKPFIKLKPAKPKPAKRKVK